MNLSIGRKHGVSILLLIATYLVLACFWQDIAFYDESIYLDSGRDIAAANFLNGLSAGPLYGLWYRILSCLCTDAEWRYFLSWGLLVVIVSILPTIAKLPKAWLYALILLAVPFFSILPYVTLFASMFIVGGLCYVIAKKQNVTNTLICAALISFIVAFCRSEYVYAVFVSASAAAAMTIVTRSSRSALASAGILAGLAVLVAVILASMLTSDMSRTGNAFAQHFNLRAAKEGLLGNDNPWLSSYAQKMFKVDESNTVVNIKASIGDFFRANPQLFVRFVLANLLDPNSLAFLPFLIVPIAAPWVFSRFVLLRPASLYVAMLSLPVIASFALIYPDRHYAVIVFPSAILLWLQLLHESRWLRLPGALRWAAVGFGALFIYEATALIKYRNSQHGRPGLETIRCLREMETTTPRKNTAFFDPIGFPEIYLALPHKRIGMYDFADWEGMRAWVTGYRPDWIVISPDVNTQYRVTTAEIDGFLMGELGYAQHACGGSTDVTVYHAK